MKKRFKAKIYEADEHQLRGVNISCNIIDDVKAPVWFMEFVETQFKPLVKDVAILKTDVAKINTRIDNLVKKNNLVE